MKALTALALLAAAAVALVLADSNGGASGDQAKRPAGLEPNVALRVSATWPGTSVPALFHRFATASGSKQVATTVATVKRGLADRGIEPGLLGRLSWLSLTLERSCPPPALLECHPEIRVCARLAAAPPAPFRDRLGYAVLTGLEAGGFRRLTPRRDRVTSAEETLARWRVDGRTLELTIGWLRLGQCARPPGLPATGIRVERDPAELALMFEHES